jgi:small GTP-binding protein
MSGNDPVGDRDAPPFALWTPRGAAGVAVLVAVGRERIARATTVLRRIGGVEPFAPTATPRLADVVVDGRALDRALVFVATSHADRDAEALERTESASSCPADPLPRLEVHVHGSEAVLRALEAAGLLATEAPQADPVQDLVLDAVVPAQLGLGLEQERLRGRRSFAECVASLGRRERAAMLDRSRLARVLAEPPMVVLCGRRNAGKSTLFNRLLGVDRAVTGAYAGLTRDPVREVVGLGGYPFELVDTAGDGEDLPARATEGGEAAVELDRAARARTRGALAEADARLLVVARDGVPGELERQLDDPAKTLLVETKSDLDAAAGPRSPAEVLRAPDLRVSALDPVRAAGLRAEVGRALARLLGLPERPPLDGVGGLAALDASEMAHLEATR